MNHKKEIVHLASKFIASEAKRRELAQGASCSGKGPLYRGTKQLNISETKHFWNMVHIRKNVCFYPLNQYP